MITDTQAAAAARLIHEHWQSGHRLAALPGALRPATRAEGYAIQAHLEPFSAAPVYGWKIAATSIAGQRHIGVDAPLAGRIFAERVHPETATIPFAANHMRVAEAEFAFRMAHDLPPRPTPYTVEEALAAVATLHPALEIPDSRFQDFITAGAPNLIADLACAHDFILGRPTTTDWRTINLATHKVSAAISAGPKIDGIGANVLADPRIALAWLVNELSTLGITLRAGQVVTTGTCLTPMPIAPHDTVYADFGILGAVSARFGA